MPSDTRTAIRFEIFTNETKGTYTVMVCVPNGASAVPVQENIPTRDHAEDLVRLFNRRWRKQVMTQDEVLVLIARRVVSPPANDNYHGAMQALAEKMGLEITD